MPPAAAILTNRPAEKTAGDTTMRPLQACRWFSVTAKIRLPQNTSAGWGHPALRGDKNHRAAGAGHTPPAVFVAMAILWVLWLTPQISRLHTKTGRIAPNSALFFAKTGQKVHDRQASAERRKSVKKNLQKCQKTLAICAMPCYNLSWLRKACADSYKRPAQAAICVDAGGCLRRLAKGFSAEYVRS